MDSQPSHKHTRYKYFKSNYIERKRRKPLSCVNCGKEGHIRQECKEATTSFGIIAFCRSNKSVLMNEKYVKKECYLCEKHKNDGIPDKVPDNDDSKKDDNDDKNDNISIYYLMVQRKDTMGFSDFVRGRYRDKSTEEKKRLLKLFLEEMTCEERNRLAKVDFDTLWDDLWMNHNSSLYIKEFLEAKELYKKLNIEKLLKSSVCKWSEPEYGFAKGRKNMHESNVECAKREFREETGFTEDQYKIINDKQWEENFTGTNGVQYRHVYFIAEIYENVKSPTLDFEYTQMGGEISNIRWMSYNQAFDIIRPYDVQKKKILSDVHEYLKPRIAIKCV